MAPAAGPYSGTSTLALVINSFIFTPIDVILYIDKYPNVFMHHGLIYVFTVISVFVYMY